MRLYTSEDITKNQAAGHIDLNRRAFLRLAAGMLPLEFYAQAAQIPIIDTHIHLFDTNRPQGVPWPSRDDKVLYKPALPDRYERIARPLNVVGAIEIEASPALEDNQWVLDVAAKSPIVVGMIGNLEPGQAGFRRQFDRFRGNRLFRGIRYGNLWGRDLGSQLKSPVFVESLRLLAQANLVMDTANPDAALIQSVIRLSDKVPDLKVIIDHLPHLQYPAQSSLRQRLNEDLRELGRRPRIYVKLSEVIAGDRPGTQMSAARYRSTLDHLFETFGEDRVLYGSDWPNSDLWGSYEEELQAVQEYFAKKSRAAQEKYFWRNSSAAYRWLKRDEKQPGIQVEASG